MISKKFSAPMRKSLDLSEVRACLRTIFFSAMKTIKQKINSPERRRAGTLVTNYFLSTRPFRQRRMVHAKKINAA